MTETRDQADTLLFRSALAELGLTIGGLTRVMIRHGDCRPATTIKRRMRRLASGELRLSGEMRVILGMLRRSRAMPPFGAAADR